MCVATFNFFCFCFSAPSFFVVAILRDTFVRLSVTTVAAREINEMRSAVVCYQEGHAWAPKCCGSNLSFVKVV